MHVAHRALLVQQLFKLGVTQSSIFSNVKAVMPTASQALPGNSYNSVIVFLQLVLSLTADAPGSAVDRCACYVCYLCVVARDVAKGGSWDPQSNPTKNY